LRHGVVAGTERSDAELEAARAVIEECKILRYYYLVRIFKRHLRVRSSSDDMPF